MRSAGSGRQAGLAMMLSISCRCRWQSSMTPSPEPVRPGVARPDLLGMPTSANLDATPSGALQLGQRHFQDAVLEIGLGLAGINDGWQRHGASEGSAADLAPVILAALFLALVRSGRPDGQAVVADRDLRSEEHTSELQSRENLVCRLLLEKK